MHHMMNERWINLQSNTNHAVAKGRWNLTAKPAPGVMAPYSWFKTYVFLPKKPFRWEFQEEIFCSPFAGKSHWLLVVGGYNEPVALGILGNGIQHHVERSIVTSKTQAKRVCFRERQREYESKKACTCLSTASSSTCHLCPPSWVEWGPFGPPLLPPSSLYPYTPPEPASHPDRTPRPETDAELPTQETWTPDWQETAKETELRNNSAASFGRRTEMFTFR